MADAVVATARRGGVVVVVAVATGECSGLDANGGLIAAAIKPLSIDRISSEDDERSISDEVVDVSSLFSMSSAVSG